MKIGYFFSGFHPSMLTGLVTCGLLTAGPLAVQARADHASGGGTYFVAPGMRSEFQFNQAHVQCKVGHGVMPNGTVMQMFMSSTTVDSVTIDSAAKTVTITGSMTSSVSLRFPDGTTAHLTETVPYVAYAEDNGTPGAGVDFFSLEVIYNPAAPGSPNQFELFGGLNPTTFAGTLVTGNVTVK
jgi:hypothetical protein